MFMAMVACAGAPAAWATDGDVAFSDPCGDNHAYVEHNDTHQDVPGTSRTPQFDLKGVKVAPTANGVSISLTMCQAPSAPDGFGGWRALYPWISGNCQLAIVAQEPLAPAGAREGHFAKTCWGGPDHSPLPPFTSDTSDQRFDITLPADAISVSGDTLTITLQRAGLTGEAAAALAPGAVWSGVAGYAAENYWVGGGGGDTEGNHDSFLAPTGFDWASAPGNTPFVVQ